MLETVLSPALFPLHQSAIETKNVVVIDILRATSTICEALHQGAKEIITTTSPEEALGYRSKGFLCAAERDGITVPGFELGNAPQDYTSELVRGRSIALTTTNGTRCLRMSTGAHQVFAGSFLNISTLASYLIQNKKPVLLFCAGWKDRFNLEDTFFAGALAALLKDTFSADCDATLAAIHLWETNKDRAADFLHQASHAQRFRHLQRESDVDVCLRRDTAPVLPLFKDGVIRNHIETPSLHIG
ncbi:MAG: 2-phosphosulfolactate phosphatase [Bacteroidetes bacterium]|nr:2-phosphosulfolactate phosphatase [Bacteroidota bacterium]